jgi:hypothetical protein
MDPSSKQSPVLPPAAAKTVKAAPVDFGAPVEGGADSARTVQFGGGAAPPSAFGDDSARTLRDALASDKTISTGGSLDLGKSPHAPGTRIGPYEVVRQLGRGAMGIVLQARHVELNRDVALKVLAPSVAAEPEAIERFRRESEAVAGLDHHGIVRLYERGESAGLHYFAMELVKGTSLDAVIRRERIPYVDAARIISQCAHAIEFAHARGILHRDLKPANILLEASGRARITDFGLARMDHKATLTSEGTVVGTPLYLAPELATGERASRKSDIYSLGATLYELATGKAPYEGRDARTVMMRVLNEAPIPPTEADPRIPKDLVRIIGKAMARKPDERYPNARALALDLDRFAQGRALEIGGGTAAFRESTAKRTGKRVLVAGGAVAALAGTITVVLVLNVKRHRAEDTATRLQAQLEQARTATAPEAGADLNVDVQAVGVSRDRDVRARTALRGLTENATDAKAGASVDAMLARARPSEKDDPALAASALREALGVFPHRWDIHLELGRTLASCEPDEAEKELTMCIVSPEAAKEVQVDARLERGRFYRARGDAISLWLATVDLQLAVAAHAKSAEAERAGVAGDLAFALASIGEVSKAETALAGVAGATGDELARVCLGRAAVARVKRDTATADAELGRARDAAASDDVKRLVDAFAR